MQNETAIFAAPLPVASGAVPPLIARLLDQFEAQWVDPASIDSWLAAEGFGVLLIAGDPVRFPESLDVAVVLPELRAACGQQFRIGIVRAEHEEALAARFGARRRPTLVCVRDGGYLGELAGMLDWDDYVSQLTAIFERPASRPPSVGIPVVTVSGGSGCH
ncbi:hypothetical protein LMG22037_06246 [Paraburkholderia phenoliruptrix]|uniref:Hydrogenase-1 operon protein HyaE n=1 Tax=Paraburkholderia phenoliruptrix TaxID=252970 RepID=A0A6J5CK46_9BURK|nr:hydrogenase [Paraburkholderia phenoliruptrix]CAB3738600.1 hypothetical protein LMG22037_06246 [Paraburkholderia phenoliruptrix]